MRIIFCLSFFLLISCLPLQAKERVLNIQEVESEGGIKAWLVEDDKLPIIALRFSFRGAGALQNPEDKQGLSLLLSNTMDEGAGELDSQAFQKELSDHSISIRFHSGRDNFGGSLQTLSRHKDKAFNLLKLALMEPRFDEEPVERMRQANLARIRSSKGKPDWINARIFNDLAYQGHPYALNSGGTVTTIKNITIDDLRTFRKNWLTKDRLVISATGDISADELGQLLDDVFGGLPENGEESKVERVEIQNTGKVFLFEKDIPQTFISVALPSIKQDDPDHYALVLMNAIFGSSGFGSRLMKEAREKRGLTYGIYSGLLAQDLMDGFEVSTSTKNQSAKEMLDIIKEQMSAMIENGVTKEELADAKSNIIGSLPLSLTSTSSISAAMQSTQLDEHPSDYLDHFDDKINAVTSEDILRVAKRILDPDNLLVVLVGSPTNIDNINKIDTLPNVE